MIENDDDDDDDDDDDNDVQGMRTMRMRRMPVRPLFLLLPPPLLLFPPVVVVTPSPCRSPWYLEGSNLSPKAYKSSSVPKPFRGAI